MRAFFDAILSFIVAESLTTEEFDSLVSTMPLYDQGTYDDLTGVLTSRGAMSTMQDRLNAFYKAKGVVFTVAVTANSNIYIGSPLE